MSAGIIQKNINNLAAELNLNTTSAPNKNVSDKTLKAAVEMFTYLNRDGPRDLQEGVERL